MKISDIGLCSGVVLLGLGLVVSGCSKDASMEANGQKDGAAARRVKPVAVKTAVAEARSVERTVEAVGTLHPFDGVTVSNEVPGIGKKIEADLGDRVKAGSTLMVLDQRRRGSTSTRRGRVQDRDKGWAGGARLKDARSTLKRNEELFAKEMVSASVR